MRTGGAESMMDYSSYRNNSRTPLRRINCSQILSSIHSTRGVTARESKQSKSLYSTIALGLCSTNSLYLHDRILLTRTQWMSLLQQFGSGGETVLGNWWEPKALVF